MKVTVLCKFRAIVLIYKKSETAIFRYLFLGQWFCVFVAIDAAFLHVTVSVCTLTISIKDWLISIYNKTVTAHTSPTDYI